jgi:cell division septation protein DedD
MRELEERRAEEQASRSREEEARSEAKLQKFVVVVATFLDERPATEALTSLLDAGYDGTLISNDAGGRLLFRVEIGPFDDLSEAERTARTLDTAYGYNSIINARRRGEP